MATVFPQEEVNEALAAFALEAGKESLVVPLLEEAGIKVPFPTIRSWAYGSRKETYQRIKSEVDKSLRTEMGDRYVSLAKTSTTLVAKVLDELLARIDEGADQLTISELNKIAHESAVVTGITFDKAMKAAGEPDVRIELNIADTQRALKARGVNLTIQGEAVEEETLKELTA